MGNLNINDVFRKYRSHKDNNEIYHDLMQFKIREVLLVSTLYDAFILEQEGHLTEKIFGEYYQLSLSNAPRITSVSSGRDAEKKLKEKHFDLVILTMRMHDMTPFELFEEIRAKFTDIPILLLLNDNTEIPLIEKQRTKTELLDKVFVWNGDSKVFLAMIKYVEDLRNVPRDTRVGHVRIILLVEDSVRYYSRYLPILYTELMKQSQRLIKAENLDEMKKLLRMRARPKIMLASTYEEATDIIDKYRDFILSVISDIKFPKGNMLEEDAGFELLSHVKKELPYVPFVLQSFDKKKKGRAEKEGAYFLDKDSDNLASELKDFVFKHLGFGKFVFKDKNGKEIVRADSFDEFRRILRDIPDESLIYHGERNQFSSWLMARGEIKIAKKVQRLRVSDFPDIAKLRHYLLSIMDEVHRGKTRGRVINFDETYIEEEPSIVRLAEGSLGGKGRGIAFVNSIIQNSNLNDMIKGANIKIPTTTVIGTEEFEEFVEQNNIIKNIKNISDNDKIKKIIVNAELSEDLVAKLRHLLMHISKPLAVRSSGQFEDSLSQPFSGIYETYLIPNNQESPDERLNSLLCAVKLVYASVFSTAARDYFRAINYKIEEEKMAVVIQEVVGRQYDNYYFPHFSGIVQSYNYYPISYIKSDDGICEVAAGLGKFVIEGHSAHRFSPKYPQVELISANEQIKSGQKYIFAVNMDKQLFIDLLKGEDSSLVKLDVSDIEKYGVLDYIASVWDSENSRMEAGLEKYGPRIINFANILKYDYFPLAQILDTIVNVIQIAMGTPVEIEFAVDLDRNERNLPTLYILQIKPVIKHSFEFTFDYEEKDKDELVMYSPQSMGNGIIDDISDIVFVKPEGFERFKTVEMAREISLLNRELQDNGKKYILIGPGRWGTQDPLLGIPVIWPDISSAKVVVEAQLEDFWIDPSLGSHFFHNIISMNVGYTAISSQKGGFIDWEWIDKQKIAGKTGHFTHIHTDKPFSVILNGIKGIAAIKKP